MDRTAGALAVEAITMVVNDVPWSPSFVCDVAKVLPEFLYAVVGWSAALVEHLAELQGTNPTEVLSVLASTYLDQ